MRSMISSPLQRMLPILNATGLNYERLAMESVQFMFNAKNGTMSAMGKGGKKSKKKLAAGENIDPSWSSSASSPHNVRGAWKRKHLKTEEEEEEEVTVEQSQRRERSSPQPFPELV